MARLVGFGPILAALLAAYVGAFWTKKRFQNTLDKKTHKKWPKNALASGLLGAPERPGQPRRAQKRTIFGNLKNIRFRRPNMHQKRSEKSIQNPFPAATNEKSRFLGPPWPISAPYWPILGAMLAHLGGSVGAMLGHFGQNVREKRSKTRVLSISDGSAATGRARFSFGEGGPVQGPWPDFRADAPQPARDPTNGEGKGKLKAKAEAIVLVQWWPWW